jgi:hypothetical protein
MGQGHIGYRAGRLEREQDNIEASRNEASYVS